MAIKETEKQDGRELFDPFSLARSMPSFSDLIESFFGAVPMPRTLAAPKAWLPRVDVHETEKSYVLSAALPGVKKEDVKITVENGYLTISGERKSEKEEKGKNCLRRELQYGSFERSFMLPESVHPEQVKATHEDGVLTVTVPKPERQRSRGVSVKVE